MGDDERDDDLEGDLGAVGGGSGPELGDGDDLDDFQTPLSRLVDRAKGWLAALLALVLVVPLGGWAIDELVFRRHGGTVEEALGEDRALADAVLLVRASGCQGRSGSGSGFVVSTPTGPVVVTNRHVVEGARLVGLRPLTGGGAIAVERYRLSPTADVAILEVADPQVLPPPLSLGGRVAEGDHVRVVGFPAARPFTTDGTVTEVAGRQMLLDLRVDPGASGSPVVDDDGTVVGQVFARTSEGHGVATTGDAIGDALEDARPADVTC